MTHLTMSQVRKMSGMDFARYLSERDPDLYGLGAMTVAKGQSAAPVVVDSKTSVLAPRTTSSINAPSIISGPVVAANNALAALLAPFGDIINLIPSPPYYTSFTADFKVRPVDALVGLFTPLDWLIYDIVNRANEQSSVHAGSARRIGLPNHQIDFVMGLDMPGITNASVQAYTKRLLAIENFLILSYQDPRSLAKGTVIALKDATVAGKVSAQNAAAFATAILQAAVARGVALFNGVDEGVVAPDNRFILALVDEIKSAFPALDYLAQAQAALNAAKAAAQAAAAQATAAAQAAAQQAAAAAQAAVKSLQAVVPVVSRYNALLMKVGPRNVGLVAEVYANGDTAIKNAADKIKTDAQALQPGAPSGIARVLSSIVSGCENVKNNASDIMGRRGNKQPQLVTAAWAALHYGPDSANTILIPTSFSGVGSYRGMGSYRGLGVIGGDDVLLAGGVIEAGGAAGMGVTTGGTAGVATAPATTPGIGGLIQQILGQFTGGAGISNILGGGASALPVITQQPASITVPQGSPAKFTVVAKAPGSSAAPLVYQWLKNDTVIPGATQASYTVPSAQPGAYGDDQYMVRISAVANAPAAQVVTSAPASLSIQGQAASGGGGAPKKLSTLDKALPIILGAGAVAAFPFFPPAAVALGVGAGAAALKNSKATKPGTTPAQPTQPGDQTISGRNLGNANLNALLNGIGDVRDLLGKRAAGMGAAVGSDPLALVATGQRKVTPGQSDDTAQAAKTMLGGAGYQMSPGTTWTVRDADAVAQYQKDHGLPQTRNFDQATLLSIRASAGSSPSTVPGAAKKSVVPAVAGVTVGAALLYAIFG